MRDMAIAQFTSASTAAIASVSLGFIPDFAFVIENHGGTNPNVRVWVNSDKASEWTGADDAILMTGSSGILTQDTAGPAVYAGGDVVTSADVTAKRYFKANGSVHAAGETTGQGLTIPAGDQTNSGKNLIIAFRSDR